jgi:peptide/nickel transport system substrate-binding protein
MRHRRRFSVAALSCAAALALSACGSGGGSHGAIGQGNTGSKAKGPAQKGGTVTIAEVGASPNFIFPLPPATNQDGYNANLTMNLWPDLAYAGDGAKSVINPAESLYRSVAYSNGDKTVTIVLKPWQWSDGKPITSRDFTFVYNLLKANAPNWNAYVSGLFPSDVTSVSTPDAHTVVLHLNRSYNPSFYTDDVLSMIPLLPQHAWDRTSAHGPVGNYDETTAGAKAVYKFLQREGSDMATFATNPLWKVVDGPFELAAFHNDGYYAYVPNPHYSGPDKSRLSKIVETPFTTDTAELDALRSGSTIDVGTLPLNDLGQVHLLESSGYSVASLAIPGVAEIIPNFYAPTVGPLLRQLYIRQALEDLIDRPQIVSKVYGGYASPGNGPVPVNAFGSLASPLEKSGGPYPYAPKAAVKLLEAHGWKVVPGGVSTCRRPGSASDECGPGVAAGARLQLQLAYSSGTASTDEQEADIQSTEAQAGVKIALKSEPFNTLIGTVGNCTAASHPSSTCSWQLVDFGYDPYPLYPAGDGFFNTGGYNNSGGYASAEMNRLIDQTEYGSSTKAFYAYEDYAARQLPWLWLPNQSAVLVYKSNLAGFTPLNPFSGSLNFQDWYYVK